MRRHLINKLNYINFIEKRVELVFRNARTGATQRMPALPDPCNGENLVCRWTADTGVLAPTTDFVFENLLFSDGMRLISVAAQVQGIGEGLIHLRLPEAGVEVDSRKARRFLCHGVRVQMIQNSILFAGLLIDFNAHSFSIRIDLQPPQTFRWIDTNAPVTLIFFKGQEAVYSGECRIVRHVCRNHNGQFVLAPKRCSLRRFAPIEHRSDRIQLVPSPDIRFRHPLTGQWMVLNVRDISGLGCAVETGSDLDVLLPGMVIADISLLFADGLSAPFTAQVIYRNATGNGSGWSRYGLAILDMALNDHVRLLNLIHRVGEPYSYFCNPLDMDMLWRFFFETGFVYPEKYAYVQANKVAIKRTYEKLYVEQPDIARHFVYQVNGRILGHMAMLRFYPNAWLIHHHAANTSASIRAGLVVLQQAVRFINDSYRLAAMHMNYVMCFFRPENKFPSHVFGGAARSLGDRKLCSLDFLAYFHFPCQKPGWHGLVQPWTLSKAQPEDIEQLTCFYEQHSGGLMVAAVEFFWDQGDESEQLSEAYRQIGLKRHMRMFTLKRDGVLKAVIMVNLSNLGLNMSDLTNCMTVWVVDPDHLPKDLLLAAIARLTALFNSTQVPVLLYPESYAMGQEIAFEKRYALWVLKIAEPDRFYSYIASLLKFIQKRHKTSNSPPPYEQSELLN